MEIEFLKLQCCGGDFLLLDGIKNPALAELDLGELAAQITSRRFGVGAAGLVLLSAGQRLRLRLSCFDPLGAQMTTDPLAVRCAARYAFDSGLLGEENASLEAADGAVAVEVLDAHNVTVPSGPPGYWEASGSLRERPGEIFTRTLRIAEREHNYTPVAVRGVQAVFFPAAAPLELDSFGPAVEPGGSITNQPVIIERMLLNRPVQITSPTWMTMKPTIRPAAGKCRVRADCRPPMMSRSTPPTALNPGDIDRPVTSISGRTIRIIAR